MARRKKVIITSNKEIYDKLNMLTVLPEVSISGVKPMQIDRILKNINKNSPILDFEIVDNTYTIKKINPLNFKIYLR